MSWYKKAQPKLEYKDTELENFKQWFGNSVVIADDGNPLICFKGMPTTSWETGKLLDIIDRSNSSTPSSFGGDYAGFFTSSPEVAGHFAEIMTGQGLGNGVYPVFLKIENPFIIDANNDFAGNYQFGEEGKPFRDALNNSEYDGIILKNTKDEADIYVPKEPNQIKSIFNSGLFNPEDPRINQ